KKNSIRLELTVSLPRIFGSFTCPWAHQRAPHYGDMIEIAAAESMLILLPPPLIIFKNRPSRFGLD
ncbi:MAG: hypothetical protein ACREDR_21645, partial [Blastocatellia bacterium]